MTNTPVDSVTPPGAFPEMSATSPGVMPASGAWKRLLGGQKDPKSAFHAPMTSAGVAVAQVGEKRLVIDHAPGRVGYKADARISGHLENFSPGDEVSLQRKDRYAWNEVNTKPVDEEGRIRFVLTDKMRTDTYRLAHTDAPGSTIVSDPVTIQVMPRLTLELSRRNIMRGRSVTLSGVLKPERDGRTVKLQHRVDGRWREITTASAGSTCSVPGTGSGRRRPPACATSTGCRRAGRARSCRR